MTSEGGDEDQIYRIDGKPYIELLGELCLVTVENARLVTDEPEPPPR